MLNLSESGLVAQNIQEIIDDLLIDPLSNDFDNNGVVDVQDASTLLISNAVQMANPDLSGFELSNVNFQGSNDALFFIESFKVDPIFAFEGGILLSTGGLPGPVNTEGNFTVAHGVPGNSLLDMVAMEAFEGSGATNDAAVLEFDLTITNSDIDGISFDIVFGSDEFPEFSNSSFVDIAAVFVNGQNFALFNYNPDTSLSVIDENLNTGNFIDNTEGSFSIEYDGFSFASLIDHTSFEVI